MFSIPPNNPMNYELLKSVQDEFQTDDRQRKGSTLLATLVKISAAGSGLALIAFTIAEHFAAA